MAVHKAGARLYRSIGFHHLVHKTGGSAHGGGGRSSNISLNLVPFVDMMTILVCFLLMVFSANGQLLQAQKGLDLPFAQSHDTLQEAPVIIVTRSDITYQGQAIITTELALKDDSAHFKIDLLYERLEAAARKIKEDVGLGRKYEKKLLEACEKAKNNIRAEPGKVCPDGLAILQADAGTDARLINKIVNTAKAAGFDNLLFAVKNK
ncbi:MAG TPA: biopolymer transporter ExbD [Kofleriaceae bacterium]|nr:biopolymer transporter ExbD [Kofleriaceae bacterium]